MFVSSSLKLFSVVVWMHFHISCSRITRVHVYCWDSPNAFHVLLSSCFARFKSFGDPPVEKHYSRIQDDSLNRGLFSFCGTWISVTSWNMKLVKPLISLLLFDVCNSVWISPVESLESYQRSFRDKWVPVTAAWRFLRLRVEEREYIEQAVADSRQGVVLELGFWARC
jgi:hypothetical protein